LSEDDERFLHRMPVADCGDYAEIPSLMPAAACGDYAEIPLSNARGDYAESPLPRKNEVNKKI